MKSKRKKQFLESIVLFVLIFILTACAKCINVEMSTVKVKVIAEYYRAAYMTPIYNNGYTTIISTPAMYKIVVEYDGQHYDFDDSRTYYEYYSKKGEYVNATLRTKYFDDGTISQKIISLE